MSGDFFEHLRAVAAKDTGRVAVEDASGTLTYGALVERAARVAARLSASGLSRARVGLLAPVGASWVTGFAGCLGAGATAVALSDLYAEKELALLVQASGARALLAAGPLVDLATRVAGSVPVLRLEEASEASLGPADPSVTGAVAGDDPALLLFTSGTTGRPKGVPITHASMLHLGRTLGDAWQFRREDTLLHVLPLHHLHGINVSLVVALVSGASVHFLPRFDAVGTWNALGRATVLMGVPTQHKKLMDAFDAAPAEQQAAWSRAAAALRLVTSGSAALPVVVGERWRRLAGQYPLERYGMTEIGMVLSNPVAGERRPGSVGTPLPGVELRIVRDDGSPAANDEPGEIWVRAPTVLSAYDDDPVATRAAFRDGWFTTGDTAKRAADGYVTLLGRTSVDILKSGGEKLSALEIEEALRDHPDIADVAVVGFPDDTWGEAVVAVVVPRAARAEALAEPLVRAWAKERLTAYKVPKRVIVVDELPKNPLGKVMKAELVRRLRRP